MRNFRGWWYHFSTYRNPPTEEGFFMYYDRIMSVPYAASVFNFTGDATLKRPYLASFVGNTVYPEYRKEIADQCRKAMQTNGDCFLGGKSVSFVGPLLLMFLCWRRSRKLHKSHRCNNSDRPVQSFEVITSIVCEFDILLLPSRGLGASKGLV